MHWATAYQPQDMNMPVKIIRAICPPNSFVFFSEHKYSSLIIRSLVFLKFAVFQKTKQLKNNRFFLL